MADVFNIEELTDILKEKISEDDLRDFTDLVSFKHATDREIFLSAIGDGTGFYIDSFIRYWNKCDNENNIPIEERKPIKIYIDSVGGSLLDTFVMIDSIKLSKTPVWTIAIGCVYSGGFFTFITGHKRFAYAHASFLYHEGSITAGGTSGQFENQSAFYKRQLGQLKDIVTQNTSISEEEYEDIKKDDVWYTVEDGIEKGFVDEVMKEFV